jgi:hypothetical protein
MLGRCPVMRLTTGWKADDDWLRRMSGVLSVSLESGSLMLTTDWLPDWSIGRPKQEEIDRINSQDSALPTAPASFALDRSS